MKFYNSARPKNASNNLECPGKKVGGGDVTVKIIIWQEP